MKIIGLPDGKGGGYMHITPPDGTGKIKTSSEPDITIILAMSTNNCIGKKNADGFDDIPWYVPEDFKHFKSTTLGHVVVPGRKTHEAILRRLGHPLPKRETVVMTRNTEFVAEGCRVVHSVGQVMAIARHRKVFIIGGGSIYRLFLPYVDKMIISHIDLNIENGDTFFPQISPAWSVIKTVDHQSVPEKNIPAFSIKTYVRTPRL